MGVALVDGLLDPGFDMVLWQNNHLEACYWIESKGTVEGLDSGRVHEITAGALYAMNNHDGHRIRAITRMRVICNFVTPLTGNEVRDADGSLWTRPASVFFDIMGTLTGGSDATHNEGTGGRGEFPPTV